ncbi:bifunctional riboflavin kinase/FAD synthetase [Corynebacterium poyangense]|uniref:Riboflavin biosynthesis protein n=1 Tax=Corynebacterium poyangense TaxID=2684405 RepID=A0A7H0SPF8_9CORY|nr:bifunctional riboflavin kinase/FAD synthetase [Corynebacterium poyangense]QNQ90433.1 bifunctional riboflavin kinase/FAD synthetase [Corynebacterium poyangense]
MDIWRGLQEVPPQPQGSVVTIGVFDGMHRGHCGLISRAVREARTEGLPCIMVTFDPHPVSVFLPGHAPTSLMSVDSRLRRAAELGIDGVLVIDFRCELAGLSPQEYVSTLLLKTLSARSVYVGDNFTFGRDASGTTTVLEALCSEVGIKAHIVELLRDEGTCISSTVVRDALAQGDVVAAQRALGRRFSVSGQIVHGNGRGGRELGFPTANMYFPDCVAIPADGVYAGWFTVVNEGDIDGDMEPKVAYPAAISVGTNPTFGDDRRSVESFVMGHEADLYGRRATVEFVAHLRDMLKFNGIEDLLTAIRQDVSDAYRALGIDSDEEN